MAVVAVHQYLVQFVQLTSCMEVVDQYLSILSKEELIDVAFLRTPHHHWPWAVSSPHIMILSLVYNKGGRGKPCCIDIGQQVVCFGFSWGCFWNCLIPLRPMAFFTFGISSEPCSSMFQMYFGSVILSCSNTSSYFLYQSKTELFFVAFFLAIDKLVTVSFTFNLGYCFRRKLNHFLPASLCILLKPSNPLASAKSKAIFLTSLADKGNPRKENSSIILTISSANKELTCYSREVGNNMYMIQFNKPKQSLVQWFSLPSCALGRILLLPLPPEQCS